jgi:hypothetical protein
MLSVQAGFPQVCGLDDMRIGRNYNCVFHMNFLKPGIEPAPRIGNPEGGWGASPTKSRDLWDKLINNKGR